jgi:hypothetical protein
LLYATSVTIVVAPWVIRNYLVFDRPIITTTGGGYDLLRENSPHRYTVLQNLNSNWVKDVLFESGWDRRTFSLSDYLFQLAPNSEEEMDRANYREAVESIRHDPGMFFVASLMRFCNLWVLCPSEPANETTRHRLGRYASTIFYLAEYTLAASGAWLIGKRWLRAPWVWGLLLVLSCVLTSTFLWSEMTLRSPFVSVIALAAGAGVAGRRWWTSKETIDTQGLVMSQMATNLP